MKELTPEEQLRLDTLPFCLEVHIKRPMSKDGMHRWSVKARRWIHPYVYPTLFTTRVTRAQAGQILKTDESIGRWLCDQPGIPHATLLVFGRSHGKNKFHSKNVCLYWVTIFDSDKYQFKSTPTRTISRYWFRRRK